MTSPSNLSPLRLFLWVGMRDCKPICIALQLTPAANEPHYEGGI